MIRVSTIKMFVIKKVSFAVWIAILSFFIDAQSQADQEQKPVLLYSRYYNAEGETRYLPDGTYSDILTALGEEFDVRVHSERPSKKVLKDVDVILVSNPSLNAVNDHPAPARLDKTDQKVLIKFVKQGGGVIVMGNQENHNLETENVNQYLSHFGMRWNDVYTDAKGLVIPKETPVVGGLKWGYYTGNQIQLTHARGVQRWAVLNDLNQAPSMGKRDAVGVLLAGAQYGRGRLVAVTDSGWIINSVLDGKGLGGVVIQNDDNLEMMKRLCRWAAGESE
jgi:hypothetical protein